MPMGFFSDFLAQQVFRWRLKTDAQSLWLPGGVRNRAAQVADALRQSSSDASGVAALLGNREVVRDSQRGIEERLAGGLGPASFQLKEQHLLGGCSHLECDRQNKVRNIGNPVSWRADTS